MIQRSLDFDVTIVGGGIIGLATAMSLSSRFPDKRLLLLEKEPGLAMHQSSHNSGVIHSGIYYRTGSLKARMCVEGAKALIEFCQRYGIPYQVCGKVVVATRPSEIPELEALYTRGCANGIKGLALIGPERLREIEPYASGIKALHVPGTGIVDFGRVAQVYAEVARKQGVDIRTSARVNGFTHLDRGWIVRTTVGDFQSRYLINCGGLQADHIASSAHSPNQVAIIPFRGEYYELVPQRCYLVKGLIYPVPNPLFPFLGVHLTRMISGKIKAGPNAVLALKREGYKKTDFNLEDTLQMLGYPGFWRMAKRHGKLGVGEWIQSLWKRAFVRALQRLVPELTSEDLVPGGSGVRAQAVHRDGSLLEDFSIVNDRHAIHILNVPSPAATASLRIGQVIAERAGQIFFPS